MERAFLMNKKVICFKTIETHTLGEPTRIVTEGFPKYAAKSMMEYKEYLEKKMCIRDSHIIVHTQ